MASTLDDLADRLLGAASAAAEREAWDEARQHAEDVLLLRPDHEGARALVELAERRRPDPTVARRRQLTVMFCDIVGSTPMAERLDPEEIADVLLGYQDLCSAAIERYGGWVQNYVGDGVLAYFSYPQAHEDDPLRAVLAGLELRDAALAYAEAVERRHHAGFSVRIGIHTGLVAVSESPITGRVMEGMITGTTGNQAARIQAEAAPGTVAISDVTHALVAGYVTTSVIGERPLRGIDRTIVLHEVTGRTDARTRLDIAGGALAPFVGRHGERTRLFGRWEDAQRSWSQRDGGTVTPVLLTGPAGVGKSRLAQVVRHRAAGDGGAVFEAPCDALSRSPLEALRAGLRRWCAIDRSDDDAAQRRKLAERLDEIGAGACVDLLTHVLGLESAGRTSQLAPTQLRDAVAQAVHELFCRLAAAKPTLVFVDDLQWADDSTIAVVQRLVAEPPPGLLTVITSRPEGPRPWSGGAVDEIVVGPLAVDEAEELATNIAGAEHIDAELIRALVERAGGVPLFIEHILRMVGPEGSTAALQEIPPSLRDLLQTQLDRLGDALPVAQLAATVGVDFDRDVVQAVWQACEQAEGRVADPAAVDQAIDRMAAAGLVVSRRGGGGRLRFRHALVADAAYECQLLAERRRRHGAIADVLVGLGVGRTRPALVARHYSAAGRNAEAFEHHVRAARLASSRGEFGEVLHQLAEAEALLDRVDDPLAAELTVRMERAVALTNTGGYTSPRLAREYLRAQEICRELSDRDAGSVDLEAVTGGLFAYALVRGDLAGAWSMSDDYERLVAQRAVPGASVVAATQRGQVVMFAGRWREARQHLEQATLGDGSDPPRRHLIPWLRCYSLLLPTLVITGSIARALALGPHAIALASSLPFPAGPHCEGLVRLYQTWALRMLGRYDEAAATAAELVVIGDRHGFTDWQLLGRVHLVAANVRRGVPGADARDMTPPLEQWQAQGNGLGLPMFLVEQAELLVLAGDLATAQALLDRAFEIARDGGASRPPVPPDADFRHDVVLAETHRVQGRLLHQRRASGLEVASELLEADAVAERQGAPLFRVKALLDLVDLLDNRHRPGDALDRLEEAVGAFGPDDHAVDIDRARDILGT